MPFPRTLSRGGTFVFSSSVWGGLGDLFENGIAFVCFFSALGEEGDR
jgi:hypothetical protein